MKYRSGTADDHGVTTSILVFFFLLIIRYILNPQLGEEMYLRDTLIILGVVAYSFSVSLKISILKKFDEFD